MTAVMLFAIPREEPAIGTAVPVIHICAPLFVASGMHAAQVPLLGNFLARSSFGVEVAPQHLCEPVERGVRAFALRGQCHLITELSP